jgi:hypothetical protein
MGNRGTEGRSALAKKGNIIALPIPPSVKTLGFDMPEKERQELIENARKATEAKLKKILGKKHDPGPSTVLK